jgi:altronate dehydratase large subunit
MLDHQTAIRAFCRENGAVGIRNHLAVISTVFCANHVNECIVRRFPDAVSITHPFGCDQLGSDAVQTLRVLTHIGQHPNVGAVLVVGLGCEQNSAHELAQTIDDFGKPVAALVIQEAGGTTTSIEEGKTLCRKLHHRLQEETLRVQVPVKDLVVGLECGGSDFTSGMVANPAVGLVADALADLGARVIFGETSEVLGAEHIVSRRATDDRVREFILDKVRGVEQATEALKVDMRGSQPSPGNMAGGLSTIAEKSLGAICKSGNRPIVDCLEYAEWATRPGISFMDSPGQDLASITGLVAGGSHMVLFTTGRGTPLGFAVAPVVKITANGQTATRMTENIDVDLSEVLSRRMSLETAAINLGEFVLAVAGGQLVQAEKLGHREFGFHSIGITL